MAELFPDETLSVAELTAALADALGHAFPDEVWVHGQIRNLDRRPGRRSVFFSLVEPAPAGAAPVAQLRVALFPSERDAVNRFLLARGAVRMEDGVEVRIRGRLGHHAASGTTRLRMTRIDPDYTLGRLAVERARLLDALAADGLLDRNRSLAVPAVPLRVALVTSRGSAAHADFLGELEASGYAWRVADIDARVQGPTAADSVCAGLATAARLGVDVVVLVRGGGARTDLAVFDTASVARAVATCPVPVFTGIGHEIDESVADILAHTASKTPTACAAALVGMVERFLGRLDGVGSAVIAAAAGSIGRGEVALTAGARRLAVASRSTLSVGAETTAAHARRLGRAAPAAFLREHNRLSRHADRIAAVRRPLRRDAMAIDGATERLRRSSGRSLDRDLGRLDGAAARVRALDPDRVLARGWSITRDASGRLVRAVRDVAAGDRLVTTVGDGVLVSSVEHEPEVGR